MKIPKIIFIIILTSGFSYAQWEQTIGLGLCFDKTGRYELEGSRFTGVFYSTNYGSNWTWAHLPNYTTKGLAVIGKYVFAGTDHTGMFYADTTSWYWAYRNNGLPNPFIRTLAVNGNHIFASVLGGVYVSTDTGSSWIVMNNGLTNLDILNFAVYGNRVFACTVGGLFVTTNNGSLWTILDNGLSVREIRSIAVNGSEIFAGTYSGGVFYSSNNGMSWTTRNNGLPSLNIATFARSGSNLFAGIDSLGVYYSSNLGQSWVPKNEGLVIGRYCYALKILDNYIFLGLNNGTWRRLLGEITYVEGSKSNVPNTFKLYQNYPNPFNPSTKINYDLPSDVNVKLVVYDVLGREVKTLINEKQNAGKHEINFDAANLPSGVYYYKLETIGSSGSGYTQTRKMVLIK